MSYTIKPFEELDVMDDFLMNAIAMDAEVGEAFCRKVLSVLLQRSIGRIRVIAQHTLPAPAPKYRGIRMDVTVEELENRDSLHPVNVFDLEPHLRQDLNLPRHNRFYQAKTDMRYMNRGENNFFSLPDLFVITILNFDPFGYDQVMYTIENHCREEADLEYRDGLKFIYFYTNGSKGGSPEIKNMLQYLQNSTADNVLDESTREIHDYISRVKIMPEVRQGYMRYEEIIAWERADAAKEAAQEATLKTARETTLENIFDLLEDLGNISEQLKKKLSETNDMGLLKKFHKLAARSESIEDFEKTIEKILLEHK